MIALAIMGCVIGLIIGCAHDRVIMSDLLIELYYILHVSTDYLLMGGEPSKEEVKNDLLSIISELSTIAIFAEELAYSDC